MVVEHSHFDSLAGFVHEEGGDAAAEGVVGEDVILYVDGVSGVFYVLLEGLEFFLSGGEDSHVGGRCEWVSGELSRESRESLGVGREPASCGSHVRWALAGEELAFASPGYEPDRSHGAAEEEVENESAHGQEYERYDPGQGLDGVAFLGEHDDDGAYHHEGVSDPYAEGYPGVVSHGVRA